MPHNPPYLSEAGQPTPPLLRLLEVFAKFPYPLRAFSAKLLARIWACLPTPENKIATLQMRCMLGEQAPPLWRLFEHFALLVFELGAIQPMIKAGCVDASQLSQMKGWIDAGEPVLALTGHLGNWELLAAALTQAGIPLTTAGRETRNRHFHKVLALARARGGTRTLWRQDGASERPVLRQLINDMRGNRMIAALIDQDTRVSSVSVPFFGVSAKTPHAMIDLAQRNKARLCTLFIARIAPERYQIFAEELPRSDSRQALIEEYNRRLECLIRKYPEQWVWVHKRWRTLPEGETLSTKQYITRLQDLAKQRFPHVET